jgi:hypothetical protein
MLEIFKRNAHFERKLIMAHGLILDFFIKILNYYSTSLIGDSYWFRDSTIRAQIHNFQSGVKANPMADTDNQRIRGVFPALQPSSPDAPTIPNQFRRCPFLGIIQLPVITDFPNHISIYAIYLKNRFPTADRRDINQDPKVTRDPTAMRVQNSIPVHQNYVNAYICRVLLIEDFK